jgi:hypothetical protein
MDGGGEGAMDGIWGVAAMASGELQPWETKL